MRNSWTDSPLTVASVALALLIWAIVPAGCADTTPATRSTRDATTAAQTAPDAADAGVDAPPQSRTEPGGVVVAVVPREPMPLEAALALGPELGGDVIAVFRTDYACVRPATGGLPEWSPEPSRFAYVEAGGIRERRLATVDSGLSPPITGWLIAESYWLHWEDQWEQAQRPGVTFDAVAVYVPEVVAGALAADPRFQEVVELPHRRTDSLDPSYAGELLLQSEELPPGILGPAPIPDCSR
jgi:hypothetical protein